MPIALGMGNRKKPEKRTIGLKRAVFLSTFCLELFPPELHLIFHSLNNGANIYSTISRVEEKQIIIWCTTVEIGINLCQNGEVSVRWDYCPTMGLLNLNLEN